MTGGGFPELDAQEAAEYLGISLRTLRKLLHRRVLRYVPGTCLFDIDDLQDYLLSRATTPEERLLVIVHGVRWTLRDLEHYPLPDRLEFKSFEATCEQAATRFALEGYSAAASAVRDLLAEARQRARMDTVEK